MKSRYILGIFAFSMILILGLSMISASGLGKGTHKEDKGLSQGERAEFRQSLAEARANGDFELMEELKSQFGPGKRMNFKNENPTPCN